MSRWYGARVALCLVVLLVTFAGLITRAALLQRRDGERLARLAVRQSSRDIEVAPRRGPILDREGAPLALSVEVESIYARPSRVPAGGVPPLAAALGLAPADVRARLESGGRFVWLRRQVPAATAARVRALERPGVGFVMEHKRFYPNGPLAGHVLGFAGLDGQGLEGIERAFDAALRGDVAHRAEARDARGRRLLPGGLDPESVAPEGAGVVLTLDRRVQFAAERVLRQAVSSAGAAGAVAVVLDPGTGEVLAMAVVPSFDPNRFAQAGPAVWRNRAVTDAVEPGSTVKALLAAAALDGGLVEPDDRFFAEHGTYRLGARVVRDTHPAGWLTLEEILRVSSNIGAIKVVERVGAERYRRALAAFGFGRRTGIELPGEADGTLRPAEDWSHVRLATAAYGYGLTATPIQIAAAFAAIANGGVAIAPRIVRGSVTAGGVVPLAGGREARERRVVAPEAARRLAAMLEQAVSPDGTGHQAAIPGYRVAGKTGTTRKVGEEGGYASDRYISSFVGIVPADRPRFVIAVFVDEPREAIYGGAVAAPAFRAIARAALAAYRIPPAPPAAPAPPGRVVLASAAGEHAYAGAPRLAPEGRAASRAGPTAADLRGADVRATSGAGEALRRRPDVVPDLTHLGMREVLELSGSLGLEVEVEGSGWVVGQQPAPGAPWPRDARLRVTFAP